MVSQAKSLEAWHAVIKAAHRGRIGRLLDSGISWSPDGSVELSMTREFLVPDDAGVYMVHDLRGTLYVGMSRRMRKRFIQHDRLRRNRLLNLAMDRPVGVLWFSWRLVEDDGERAVLERHLIQCLQPVCNRQLLGLSLS